MRHAFKEWAVICKALGQGYQTLILRKGGILEIGAGFQVEHPRFWLFPTYTHQQTTGVVPAALPMLKQVEAQRPPEGIVRLSHFAEAHEVHHVVDLERVLALGGMHFWADETVRQRFAYRRPGLFVLTVRVYQAPQAPELPLTPYYEGCKSWVELEQELETTDAWPVLAEEKWTRQAQAIRQILQA